MDDLERHFGGTMGSKGDAGDFIQWLCLHGTDSTGRWVLWLESGEINGGYVGSFEWRRALAGANIDRRCVVLKDAPQLPIPLKLGIPASEVSRVLGPPTPQNEKRLIYLHEHEESIRGEPYDSSNTVMVHLRNGFVSAIAVSKTTSD